MRHGLQDDDSCSLCSQSPETIDHLLISCPFSRELWFKLLHKFGWNTAAPGVQAHTLVDWWEAARKNIQKDKRKGFDSIVVLSVGCSGKKETQNLWPAKSNNRSDVCLGG
jgi:hypothetical protein